MADEVVSTMFRVIVPGVTFWTTSATCTNGIGWVWLTGSSDGLPVLSEVLRPESSMNRSRGQLAAPWAQWLWSKSVA